jgi:hypothetical protein
MKQRKHEERFKGPVPGLDEDGFPDAAEFNAAIEEGATLLLLREERERMNQSPIVPAPDDQRHEGPFRTRQ